MRITDAFPTGTGAIVPGCTIDLGIEHNGFKPPWNVDIGTGIVSALSALNLAVSGTYAFDTLGQKGNGTFSFGVSSPDGGQTWLANAVVTGTWNINQSNVPVQASESGSATSTTITYSAGGVSVVQTFQQDNPSQKAKVYIAFTLSGTPITLYMYNLTAYGDVRDIRRLPAAA